MRQIVTPPGAAPGDSLSLKAKPIKKIKSRADLWSMFTGVFFLSVSSAIVAYFLSSYLKTLVDEKYIGLIFMISSAISMVFINFFPYIISRLGALKSFLFLVALNFLTMMMLAAGGEKYFLLSVFVIFLSANSLLFINYDVIIEMFSKDVVTGRIRGLSLTLMNLGWVFTPLLAAWLIGKYGFSLIFVVSALILVPPFLIVGIRVKPKPVKFKKHTSFLKICRTVYHSKPLRSVFFVSFLLSFFYSWMVIYTPLYLLDLGFTWTTIGKIFSVMLIPFVIFQYPVGYLADKYFGETEMMSLALVIMAISTGLIFYYDSPIALAILLFGTRIGASIIEALRDSYFYKHISADDVDLIDAFRNTGPLAYILGPLLATILLYFVPLIFIYPILAAIVLTGLACTLTMPDTK